MIQPPRACLSVWRTEPGILCQVNRTTGLPREDILRGSGEECKVAIRSRHTTHWLATCSVCNIFIGNFDTRHVPRIRIQPDGSLVFCTDTCERWCVGCLETNTSVVGTSKSTALCDCLELACRINILHRVAEMPRSPTSICSDDEIRSIQSRSRGKDKVAVDIRGSSEPI